MSAQIFSSNKSEERWVDQLNKNFIIYVDNPPSIFHVSKSVFNTNSEAYTPQHMGIGAYNHFRIDQRKLEAVKKFLKPQQYTNFKSLIVDKVKELDPDIRSCYNKYLDIDGDTLAWIMAIDGVYLLHLLSTYSGKTSIEINDRNLAQDILMVENQMPSIVLKEIQKALQPSTENYQEVELFTEMLSFCKAHSPLSLTDNVHFAGDTTSPHLLHYLYTLIIKSWYPGGTSIDQRDSDEDTDDEVTPLVGVRTSNDPLLSNINGFLLHIESTVPTFEKTFDEVAGEVTQVTRVAANLTGRKTFMLLANLPLQQFADLFKKGHQKTDYLVVEEIQIPSASEIHEVCKIDFQVWPNSGIGVKYDEKTYILYLPEIRINTDSEVILRNLVAYEEAASSGSINKAVSSYVDFMCGILDTEKDVDLLKEKGIIKSNLQSVEIAKIFNGIQKSTRMMRPDIEDTVQKLKMIDDNIVSVKAWRFIKDHLIPTKCAVQTTLGMLMVLLLTLQAFCEIYGCRARGSSGKILSFIR